MLSGSEKLGKVTVIKAGQSSSAVAATMIMADKESGSRSGETEASQEPQTPADSSLAVVAGTPHNLPMTLVSCVSTVKVSVGTS